MSFHLEKQKLTCGNLSRSTRLLAADEKSGKLAVLRKPKSSEAHDYVEFYSFLSGWLAFPELTVCPENGSIEHMMFIENGELMTSHANGSVCFIDPHNNMRVKRVQVSASTIWSACKHPSSDKSKSTVALISHSSVLYFFDINAKIIISSISLGVESRLFDLSSSGKLVAIGSIDGIILAGNGKVQQTLKLDRQNRRDPTVAWTVLFIKPSLLACGDSRGTITFWNPDVGTLIQSVSCMQSHILTLCWTNEILYAAGVDPRIIAMKEVTCETYEVVNRQIGPSKDVRSLVAYENKIFSAGEDHDIYVCEKFCRKLQVQQQKNIIVAADVVASAGENYIDIWWKQHGEDMPFEGSHVLHQHYEMIHLAKIYAPSKRIITSWMLSSCGERLVIGTSSETTLYKIAPTASKLNKKIVKFGTFHVAATAFHVTGERFFAARGDFEVVELLVTESSKQMKSLVNQSECGAAVKMIVSPCGIHIIILTTRSQLFSINSETGESRLVKIDMSIDITCNFTSLFVLTAASGFSESTDSKKVLYEVGLSNGIIKRSTFLNQLRMASTTQNRVYPELPISLMDVGHGQLMVTSYGGGWSIVDTTLNGVAYTMNKPLTNENAGVCVLEVTGEALPKACGFKLKKFGMQ
ncbi:unnamed protein product [Caenorhabditis sp. 36 PRJEB53466]|nr:unnamed protein product [Caenorhabditis sp. 36 PRJEB53466]